MSRSNSGYLRYPAGNRSEIDFAQRQRAHLLRADLQALGMKDSTVASLPRCQELPKIDDCFDGLGCLYVLEGSTLGGKLIARELERRFGLDQQSGAAFFNSYGADVGSMWMEFCLAVRTYVGDPKQREQRCTRHGVLLEVFRDGWER